MEKSYYLEDVTASARLNPRHFLMPSNEELNNLKAGDKVRLFFVFNFETEDGCRAERMWIELSEINGTQFTGYLTNKPLYIKDLSAGDLITFERKHIASVLLPHWPDATKKAIITQRALEMRAVNWLVREEPFNETDSGWQLFYGDEDDTYLEDADNAAIVSLEEVLDFEPLLEEAFQGSHGAYEWDAATGKFAAV
ncbi:hypothetical protein HNQ91_001092 [Filimonas zeae]|uniref:DUF2185 domain-containing protein n=1 Tax=Filimonas zeae TaxID=1737353 RepID=A0A917IRI2_9BACT|nr:DUF2185 domain-containing protein [Filimonas zeae]MDR6338070.1 hypothetical protein [Filimonas zeae]GGH61560.1 hypothetical protein GCM10011379_10670 [Filimonas zeae]